MARPSDNVLSHWSHLFDEYSTSTTDFYSAVEAAVKARKAPDVNIERVDFHEGGVLSAKREYLRVRRGQLAFDICAAPYGRGQFFSWWLVDLPPSGAFFVVLVILAGIAGMVALCFKIFGFFGGPLASLIAVPIGLLFVGHLIRETASDIEATVLAVPYLGAVYARIFSPPTYYRTDTALMFQETVRGAVMEALQGLRSGKGLRALSPEEWKPTMRDLTR
jgi:hypothetical protein